MSVVMVPIQKNTDRGVLPEGLVCIRVEETDLCLVF